MITNPILRRLVTVPALVVTAAALTALLPLLAVAGAVVDAWSRRRHRRRPVAVRLILFAWVYAALEVWALVALALTSLLPRHHRTAATYQLQQRWAAANFAALRRLFCLEVTAEGAEEITPGPIVVLSRHASIVDTLLPAHFVTREAGIRLRYVLKSELLWDPALDIAGNRLPNRFVDRGGATEAEREGIRRLALSLGDDEGVLIYPEGTRATPAKLARSRSRMRAGRVADVAAGLRHLLPPRPSGTLAVLEASTADVVVLAHHGLEGLARIADVLRGGLVGSSVRVRFWRIARSQIPDGLSARTEWLYRLWAEIDQWVAEAAAGTA